MRFFSAETPDVLSEHFVELQLLESSSCLNSHFGFFHREACGLPSLSVPLMQRRFRCAPKPGLVGYCRIYLLSPPTRLLFVIIRRTELFPPTCRAADEATFDLNRFHFASACAVPSESCRNKDDTLSAKVVLIYLPTYLFRRPS